MRGQKRVLKGVHARLRRAMDARERAYDPRIHLLCKKVFTKWMDCTATRACPSCAGLRAASRVNPTCGVKPGNDDLDLAPIRFRGGDNYMDRVTRSHAGSLICAGCGLPVAPSGSAVSAWNARPIEASAASSPAGATSVMPKGVPSARMDAGTDSAQRSSRLTKLV